MQQIKEGDLVQGSVSGRYLGKIRKVYKNTVLVTGPDGAIFQLGKMLVARV